MKKNANHVVYIVDNMSLMEWCELKGYPYSASQQMLNRGLTVNQMKARLKGNYYSSSELNKSMKEEAYHLSLIYKKSSRENRLRIREEFTNKWSNYNGFEAYWEKIVTGNVPYSHDFEFWKKVEGDLQLEVSNKGNFRRWLKDGCRKIRPFEKYTILKSGRKRKYLAIKCKKSKHALYAGSIVAEAFIPKPKDDMVIHFIDGDSFNIKLSNLKWVSRNLHGMLTGFTEKSAKAVVMLDENDNVVEEFESVRQTGLELCMSYTTVSDYCLQKVKKPMFKLMFKEVFENEAQNHNRSSCHLNHSMRA